MKPAQRPVSGILCPSCEKEGLQIEYRPKDHPLPSYSRFDEQLKLSANTWVWITCRECGVEAPAREGRR